VSDDNKYIPVEKDIELMTPFEKKIVNGRYLLEKK
jgi:hypothetical protein